MIRKATVLAFVPLLWLISSAVYAQEGPARNHGEVSLEGTGFFTKDSRGNAISQHSTDTGPFNLQANVHQATAALVVTLPGNSRIIPYALAGAGALVFDPTN